MFIKNIPDYAKDFKNEYLFILGINNEFKYFLDNMDEATRGLFENFRVDKIKKFISKFLLYQNSGYFKDLSNFEIKSSDIKNLIRIKKNFNDLNNLIKYRKDCYDGDGDEQNFVDPYPGFKNIYYDFVLFCSKFKIKYESNDRFWDYNAERNRYRYRYCFSDSDTDGD